MSGGLALCWPDSHLFQPSVVSDIFSLCHPAVDIKLDAWQFVLVVLVNDTLGLSTELLYGHIVPPLLQVAVFVKLPAPRTRNCGVMLILQ